MAPRTPLRCSGRWRRRPRPLQRFGISRGDLLLLDADPTADITATRRIHAVVQAGRVLDRALLDGMLAGVRAAADR